MQGVKSSDRPSGLFVTALLTVVLWGIAQAHAFLIPICISAVLAFTMSPLVQQMRKKHFPEWSAIVVSSALLVLPFLGLVSVLAWQSQALVRDFPAIMAKLNTLVVDFAQTEVAHRLHMASDLDLSVVLRRFEGSAGQGIQLVIGGLKALLDAGSQTALVLLFAILMLSSRQQLRRCSEKILAQSFSVADPQILDEVVSMVEKFLIARLLIVAIVGGVDTLVLAIFGVRYALLLGSFLGLMTLIPAIGFVIALIPPIIVAFATGISFVKIVIIVAILLVVSFVEGNVLTPKMVGKRININALSTFVGLFAGGLMWGIWGMFLSIPVLGILRIVFNAAPSLRPWGELLAERDVKTTRKVKSLHQ